MMEGSEEETKYRCSPSSIEHQAKDEDHTESVTDDHDDDDQVYNVELGQAGASLPAVEELKASMEAQNKQNKDAEEASSSKKGCRLLLMLVFLGLLMSLTVGLVISTKEKKAENSRLSDSDAAGWSINGEVYDAENAPRRSNYTQVKDFMIGHGISLAENFVDPDSPQAQAASWLAELDPANLDIPGSVEGDVFVMDNYDFRYMARYILSVLYFATNGGKWTQQFNFLTKGDVCTWKGYMIDMSGMKSIPYGVACDFDGVIWGLYLDRMGLDGEIPNEIGMLKTLEMLDLTFNEKLVGRFPRAACELSNLDALYLGHTHITGDLPTCIGQLTNLRSLFLSDTLLAGRLPAEMSQLSKMEELMLDNNHFSGDITTIFDEMPLLQYLFLEDNSLSATVGDDTTFLTNNTYLTQIDVSNNDLSGVVPSHFFNRQSMPLLQLLDLHGNRLIGILPEDVPENDALLVISLQENSISGSIPISWTQKFTNLYHLDLSSNSLNGPMTPEIGNMNNLQYLFLANNPFQAGPLPETFANLTKLEEFSIKSTNRQGAIPDFIGNKWPELILLDLDDNELTGNIPTNLGNLAKLQFLLMNRNQLVGQVPSSLTQLQNLRAVFLEGNQLTGELDSTLCTLPSFVNGKDDDKTDSLLVADCLPSNQTTTTTTTTQQQVPAPLACECCQICCAAGDGKCHENYAIADYDPQWQKGYNRVNYDFGNATRFVYRNYIKIDINTRM